MPQFVEGLETRRLMASGTLDASFGTASGTTTRVPIDPINETLGTEPQTAARQISVDAGGRTVVLARTASSATLYRLTEAGTFDARFAAATGGYLRLPLPTSFGGNGDGVSIALDDNNRTYVQIGPQVLRVTSSGKIDKTYGLRGNAMLYQTAQFAGGNDIAVEPDGSAYVVGSVNVDDNRRMAVAKLLPNGVLDRRFAFPSRGVLVAPPTGASADNPGTSTGDDIRILNDGSVMATGRIDVDFPNTSATRGVTGAIALKFRGDTGTLDVRYGRNGRSVFTIATTAENFRIARSVSIRGDGAVLHFASDSGIGDNNAPLTEANYLTTANGRSTATIDVTLGNGAVADGKFVPDTNVFPGDANAGSELFVDRLARALTRYTKSGATYTLDTTFNGGRPILCPQAVATTGGGAIVFAGTGRSATDNALTVGRVFATEAPSVQASIPPLTKPVKDAVVSVLLRDDKEVIFDPTDGVPTGAVLNGPKGPIAGRLVRGGSTELAFAFTGPGGTWDRTENGVYTVDINFNDLVHDRDGGVDGYIGTKRVGKLIVAIA